MGAGLQDDGHGVAIDSLDNVYLGGFFRGSVDFDRTASSSGDTSTSLGSSDSFLLKLDSSGVFQWVRSWGGTGADSNVRDAASAVAVDGGDNVYTTGAFDVQQGSVDFDQTASHANDTDLLGGAGLQDAFVLKHDASGDFQWVRGVGGSAEDAGLDINVDEDGLVYTVGANRSSDFDANPDPQEVAPHATAGLADGFLLTLDAGGEFIFAGQLGGTGNDLARSVTVAADTNVVVSGSFDSTTGDFDPTSGDSQLGSAGGSDGFVSVLELASPSPRLTVANTNPVAADQSYTTEEDTPLNLSSLLAGVDDNGAFSYSDPGPLDEHSVAADEYASQQGGLVTIAPDGSVTYQPLLDFSGGDSFGFTLRDDDGGLDVGAITVTVNPVNDPPTLDPTPAPPAIRPEVGEQTITLTGITAGGGENQDLRIIATSSNESIIGAPTVDYTSAQTDAVLRYSPTGNSLGPVTITVTVIDAGFDSDLDTPQDNGSFEQQIVVVVREFPWTNADEIYDVNADGQINVADAIKLISELRSRGVGASLPPVGPSPDQGPFIDINSNNKIDLQDAFSVIGKVRELFGGGGEGEAGLGMTGPKTNSLSWVGNEPWRTVTDVALADDEDWIGCLNTLAKLDAPLSPSLEAPLREDGASGL